MKQFLDVFTNLQQMDAGAWIAAGALVTFFGLALYSVVTFFSRLWWTLADMRNDEMEGK